MEYKKSKIAFENCICLKIKKSKKIKKNLDRVNFGCYILISNANNLQKNKKEEIWHVNLI